MNLEANEMMMDLFRSEVEVHSESLTASLLALEHDASDAATLDRLMRAAHSIKGAARIVRVDPAVDVAHVMEDCIVAAQKGKLQLTSEGIDVLLRGVDVLVKVAAATKDPQTDWSTFGGSVRTIVAELEGVLRGGGDTSSASSSLSVAQASVPVAAVAPPSAPPAVPKPAAKVVLRCPEVLDAPAAESLRNELLAALDAGKTEFEMDLSATRDLDAIGVAFLAAARRHLLSRPHVSLRFQPVSADMQTVLEVTGLDAPATETASL